MRKILPVLAVAMGLTTTATTADALVRYGDDLRFVEQTQVPGTNGTMALCHLVDFMDGIFIPVYTRFESYALSNSGCEGEMYRKLTAGEFAELQSFGFVSADLPAEPTVSLQNKLWGHAWLIFIAVALAFKGLAALGGRGRTRKAGTPDTLAIHSLVAMSQVAVADGRIDEAEVRQISHILTRLTGQSYAPAQVADLLNRLNPSPSDMAQVGNDLSEGDRQIVLEAALNIAVADGEIHPSEYAVVSDLAQRLRIGAEQFRSTLARLSAHLHTAQPV